MKASSQNSTPAFAAGDDLTVQQLGKWEAYGGRLQPFLSSLLFNAGESGALVDELRARQHELSILLRREPTNNGETHV
jgi:hypothetical protein